jgi:hypothetical protein
MVGDSEGPGEQIGEPVLVFPVPMPALPKAEDADKECGSVLFNWLSITPDTRSRTVNDSLKK